MDEKMLNFLRENTLLSWAMSDEDGGVYCANAFYAFDELNLALIIASYNDTKHIKLAKIKPKVSVNIAKFSSIATLKGIQIKAFFQKASKIQSQIYLAKFPFSRLSKARHYALNIEWAKFTNNALGKKLEFRVKPKA